MSRTDLARLAGFFLLLPAALGAVTLSTGDGIEPVPAPTLTPTTGTTFEGEGDPGTFEWGGKPN
ncbi:hypothetical protein AB0M02_20420 [Actinoplanes sp. NPDC051861]|uniref:hypothetical protein n=1 Tax=Actinoplanes sp. NPDC051861 TaxID=3155170 RepID=UPI003419BF63